MKNIFRPMQICTVLTQGTLTVFINQLPISNAFKEALIILGSTFSDNKYLIFEKARFKTALILKHRLVPLS